MLASLAQSVAAGRGDPFAPHDDYRVVQNALRFLSANHLEQPSLAVLAAHLKMEPTACQKLFKRWCGLSPKEFLQAVTFDRARELLAQSETVMHTAHEAGLSGSGRLYDLCVSQEAVTPGCIRQRGQGEVFRYGFHETPFGEALLLSTSRGLAGLSFASDESGEDRADVLDAYRTRWPAGVFEEDQEGTRGLANAVFAGLDAGGATPRAVRIVLIGTDFEIRVWQALLDVPLAGAASYRSIARRIGNPKATRAVGTAIGHNPISFVVPCHRILRQDGGLGGYRWGVTRKRAMIGWELGFAG